MAYFSKDFIGFFSELKKKNNRDWFLTNKDRYLYSVKTPFELFVQELIHKIQEEDDSFQITAKESVFRIYRDVRFSKDKSPYKTFASAIISQKGRRDLYYPGFYFEFDDSEIRIYTGAYFLNKNQLYSVRKSIQENLLEFRNLISEKRFKNKFGKTLGEKNKIIPKEFRDTFNLQPLIANKEFYYHAKLKSSYILGKNFADKIFDYYLTARGVNDFFIDAINPMRR